MNPGAAPFLPGSFRPSTTTTVAATPPAVAAASSKPNINAAPFTPGGFKAPPPPPPPAQQQQPVPDYQASPPTHPHPAPAYEAPPPPPQAKKQPPQYTGSPYANSAPPPFKPSPLQPPRYPPVPAYGVPQQPGLWLPPQAPGAHLPRGFCIQLLGCRGSGKTTQSELLAEKYNLLNISGGKIREAGKWPHLELPIILGKYFGPNAEEPSKYNGVVLDRFVALHETDALYIEAILKKFGMHLTVTFHLDVSPEIAHSRAETRKDGKDSSERLRTLEYRVQFSVANNMYAPQGTLSNVCAEDYGIDVVHRTLVIEVERIALLRQIPKSLPVPHHPHTQGYAKQVTDFALFYQVRTQLLAALNNGKSEGVPLRFPGSQMAGVVDEHTFANTRNITTIYTTYATLKADGQRILICKNKHGIFGFNNVFHFMYDFGPYVDHFKVALPNVSRINGGDADFDFVLDCELFTDGLHPKIAVFDFLILGSAHGKEVMFEKRLEMMSALLPKYTTTAPFFLKDYVPAGEVRSLLPDFNSPPYPIDGVVFQHKGAYTMGRDRFIQKWKPEHMCTVDFRLIKATAPAGARDVEWVFEANVGSTNVAHEEETVAKTKIIVHNKDVEAYSICDGTIAECRKRRAPHPKYGSDITVWDFVRARPDKSGPNRCDVYDSVNSMQHLSYEQLAAKLDHIHSKRAGSK